MPHVLIINNNTQLRVSDQIESKLNKPPNRCLQKCNRVVTRALRPFFLYLKSGACGKKARVKIDSLAAVVIAKLRCPTMAHYALFDNEPN